MMKLFYLLFIVLISIAAQATEIPMNKKQQISNRQIVIASNKNNDIEAYVSSARKTIYIMAESIDDSKLISKLISKSKSCTVYIITNDQSTINKLQRSAITVRNDKLHVIKENYIIVDGSAIAFSSAAFRPTSRKDAVNSIYVFSDLNLADYFIKDFSYHWTH